MKTVTYPLRLPWELYHRVQCEAAKRQKKLSELFRDLIPYGLEALPAIPDTGELLADVEAHLKSLKPEKRAQVEEKLKKLLGLKDLAEQPPPAQAVPGDKLPQGQA